MVSCICDYVIQVSGTLVGCVVDTSVGELTFQIGGQDTGHRFRVSKILLFKMNQHVVDDQSSNRRNSLREKFRNTR